jgi:hypothetical protein
MCDEWDARNDVCGMVWVVLGWIDGAYGLDRAVLGENYAKKEDILRRGNKHIY